LNERFNILIFAIREEHDDASASLIFISYIVLL